MARNYEQITTVLHYANNYYRVSYDVPRLPVSRKADQLSYFNVIVDCAGFVAALGLVITVIAKTDKSLGGYFVIPVVLLCVHVYGNTVQELELGPAWVRNHLHNVGVASLSLTWGSCLILRDIKRKRLAGYDKPHIIRHSLSTSFCYWLLLATLGAIQEVLTVVIWGENARAAGYSGEIDWFDLSAYAIGSAIITLNYLWFKPRILAKVQ